MKILSSIHFSTLLIYNSFGNHEPEAKVEISAIGVGLADSYEQ
jgi:hypothetical protein